MLHKKRSSCIVPCLVNLSPPTPEQAVLLLLLCAFSPASAIRSGASSAIARTAPRSTGPSAQRGALPPVVSGAEHLLCGLGADGGAAREDACAARCTAAAGASKLPPFPQHFFGGLSKKERDKGPPRKGKGRGKDGNRKGEGRGKDGNRTSPSTVVLDTREGFAFPMRMGAYFSCYTRSKWPLFTAWVVAPELQVESTVPREGTFGNVPKDSPEHNLFHKRYKGEFLRAGDVKGVWSEYFGFDQGHWAPDATFRSAQELVKTTYYYINVSPQTACLNRQEWGHLESSIRDWSVREGRPVSVMSGPLEELPRYFVSTPAMRKKWLSILETWRVASEVLMEGVGTARGLKDPHWIEVTAFAPKTPDRHCMFRGEAAARRHGVDRDELRDLAGLRPCKPKALLSAGLAKYAFFLMTQAGKSAKRRGVRVPLAYWKVVSWERSGEPVYCCYLMDQTGMVDMTSTGADCLAEVGKGSGLIPDGIVHAGERTCGALFTPRGGRGPAEQAAQGTQDCDFASRGIGWRGEYLLDENDIDY